MIFNSYFFILFFLPVTVLGYYAINKTGKYQIAHFFLLFMSLWFYAYANIYYLPVILGSIVVNYLFFTQMSKGRYPKLLLVISVFANLSVLFYFKYYNFFIDSTNIIFKTNFSIREILLPLGISFMTFQQIAFMADSYKGKVKRCSFGEYALFIAFFPHVISGPIITCEDFIPLIRNEGRRKINWDRFSAGLYRFAMGLGKKVLLADVFAKGVDYGYGNLAELNATSAVFISLAYTIQIYFDFSGYSDMAIGLSQMLNLDLPENFNSPYKAKTIVEFWDRWHMTLTRFFTRYVYIPLGGSRKGEARTWLNTMIVFVCSGFWHGASWTFILWGFLHGVFLVLTKKFRNYFEKIPATISWAITMLFVNTSWILFRAGSFGVLKEMCRALFSNNWGALNTQICCSFDGFLLRWTTPFPQWFAAALYTLISVVIILKCKNTREKSEAFYSSWQSAVWTVVVVFLSLLSFSAVSTYVYANF